MIKSCGRVLVDSLNYGLFWPGCYGKEGKFLREERLLSDYPLQQPICLFELKYKKRYYSGQTITASKLKKLQSKKKLTRFLEYVEAADIAKVNKKLLKGIDPNFQCSTTGETPLTMAVKREQAREMIMTLVNGGAHVDYRSRDSLSPLHKSAIYGNYEAICTLLDLGHSPNCRDEKGLTPLYYTVTNDTPSECTARLLYDHANVGVEDANGLQEIHQACRYGRSQHLEHLMLYGRDLDVLTRNGNTPLHICSIMNQESCARLLLFRGASRQIRNNNGETAFDSAINNKHQRMAEIILNFNDKEIVLLRDTPKLNPLRNRAGSASEGVTPPTNEKKENQSTTERAVKPNPRPELPVASASLHHLKASRDEGNVRGSVASQPTSRQSVISQSGDLYKYLDSSVMNIPRIIVLQRGMRGFGFLLRPEGNLGPNDYDLSLERPSFHYFHEVDPDTPAAKAGVRPGDFILELNSQVVTTATHRDVVSLIRNTGDTLALKIITVNIDADNERQRKVIADFDETLSYFDKEPLRRPTPGSLNKYQVPRMTGSPSPPHHQGRMSMSVLENRQSMSMNFQPSEPRRSHMVVGTGGYLRPSELTPPMFLPPPPPPLDEPQPDYTDSEEEVKTPQKAAPVAPPQQFPQPQPPPPQSLPRFPLPESPVATLNRRPPSTTGSQSPVPPPAPPMRHKSELRGDNEIRLKQQNINNELAERMARLGGRMSIGPDVNAKTSSKYSESPPMEAVSKRIASLYIPTSKPNNSIGLSGPAGKTSSIGEVAEDDATFSSQAERLRQAAVSTNRSSMAATQF